MTTSGTGSSAVSRTIIAQSFEPIVSSTVTGVKLSWEAISVADLNGDGKPDLILANGGGPRDPIADTDGRTTIFLNDGANKLVLADTSRLQPTGWVNDWLVLPVQSGLPLIVGIDHGREIAYDPKYFSKLELFRFENGSFVDVSGRAQANPIAFYHNASSYGDLNRDGLQDFVTAKLSTGDFAIFLGDHKSGIADATEQALGTKDYNSWGNAKNAGSTGAALVIDILNDGQDDFVLLPYTHNPLYATESEGVYADAFVFRSGRFLTATKSDVRHGSDFTLPDTWGYSFAQVADINRDGLKDIVALAENPDADAPPGHRAFVSMIQKPDGSFSVSKAFPDENIITDSRQSTMVYAGTSQVWSEYKFNLVDIDGDGLLDLFWGSWFNGKPSDLGTSCFFGDGNGHFKRNPDKANRIFRNVSWNGTARTYMADFNHDGLGDLLVLQSVFVTSEHITPIVFINRITFG